MPFKSEAQRRLFHAKARRGEMSKATVARWEEHTPKDKKLPRRVAKSSEHVLLAKLASAKTPREQACLLLRYTAYCGKSGEKKASDASLLGLSIMANELVRTKTPLSKLAQQHLNMNEKQAAAFSKHVANTLQAKRLKYAELMKQAKLRRAFRSLKTASTQSNAVTTMTGNVAPAALSASPMMAVPGGMRKTSNAEAALAGGGPTLGPGGRLDSPQLTPQQRLVLLGLLGTTAAAGGYPLYRAAKGFSNAPKGFGLEGAARGGYRGAGTVAGALGGLAGGGAVGGILHDLAQNSQSLPDSVRNPLALAAAVGTPIAGAIGGGMLGNRLTSGGLEPADSGEKQSGVVDDAVSNLASEQAGDMVRQTFDTLQKSHGKGMRDMASTSGWATGGVLSGLLGAVALPLLARRFGGGAAWKNLLKQKILRTQPKALETLGRELWPKGKLTGLGDGGSALLGAAGGLSAGSRLGSAVGGLTGSGKHEFDPNTLPSAISDVVKGSNPALTSTKKPTTKMPT